MPLLLYVAHSLSHHAIPAPDLFATALQRLLPALPSLTPHLVSVALEAFSRARIPSAELLDGARHFAAHAPSLHLRQSIAAAAALLEGGLVGETGEPPCARDAPAGGPRLRAALRPDAYAAGIRELRLRRDLRTRRGTGSDPMEEEVFRSTGPDAGDSWHALRSSDARHRSAQSADAPEGDRTPPASSAGHKSNPGARPKWQLADVLDEAGAARRVRVK